jgi:3-phosphoshikimate 1-carboxyvinyltransferase
LRKVGANFKVNNKKTLPLKIVGSSFVNPIHYVENRGSAQCKSTVMLAALNSPGQTIIKAKKSRDHTENFFKYLGLPIIVKKNKYGDEIKVKGQKAFNSFKYKVPSDPSSCAFFIVLTLLSKNCELKIKNVNINNTRIGYIKILNKMGAKIKVKNVKKKYGEKQADIYVKSQPNLKKINCPPSLSSNLIDEFLIIFLAAAKAKGVSSFKNLGELNKKESPRLKLGSKLLNQFGIKTKLTKDSIRIFGNPAINFKKNIIVKDYFKDHRIFMTSVIAAYTFGGKWKINDANSYKSSFPSFLNIIKKLGYKFKVN